LATKYLKVVISLLYRGTQKELDAPIESEHDIFIYSLDKVINDADGVRKLVLIPWSIFQQDFFFCLENLLRLIC